MFGRPGWCMPCLPSRKLSPRSSTATSFEVTGGRAGAGQLISSGRLLTPRHNLSVQSLAGKTRPLSPHQDGSAWHNLSSVAPQDRDGEVLLLGLTAGGGPRVVVVVVAAVAGKRAGETSNLLFSRQRVSLRMQASYEIELLRCTPSTIAAAKSPSHVAMRLMHGGLLTAGGTSQQAAGG